MTTSYRAVESEIRSLIKGECRFDSETREQYSTAACWYKITPVGVVFPVDEDDVQKVVQFCSEIDIPVIPRGGGTGLAGQSLGMGIVLDFKHRMNRVRRIEASRVEVDPGVILHNLNEHLFPANKFFPVDPVSGKLCTIGGMISTNAAGPHGVKYGSTKDHVESLMVVLSNGELATIPSDPAKDGFAPGSFISHIHARLQSLLETNKEEIIGCFPKVAKNSSGYNLLDAVRSDLLDLRKLIIGSEGTLAIVVRATLRLSPLPMIRRGAVAHFRDYPSTVEATLRALDTKPSAIEIMDRTYFAIGKGLSDDTDALLNDDAVAMLYFEYEGDSEDELESSLRDLQKALRTCHPLSFMLLRDIREQQKLFDFREAVSKKMNLEDALGKTSFIEDVAVPILNMPAYMIGLTEILRRHSIEFSAYGHAGSGNIHCGTFLEIKNQEYYGIIDRVASEVNDLAISLGGTLSGEHGDGFVRTPFLERLYGSTVYNLFKQVKQTFDPFSILNPGKIVGPQNTSILHDIDFS